MRNLEAEQIRQIDRDRIAAAAQTPPEEKLLAGGRLFDEMIQRMIAGIQAQFPEANEDEIWRELDRRLELAERLENRQWTPTK
jgi:hypothetical protein